MGYLISSSWFFVVRCSACITFKQTNSCIVSHSPESGVLVQPDDDHVRQRTCLFSLTHPLFSLFSHLLTQSLTHLLTYSLTHSLTLPLPVPLFSASSSSPKTLFPLLTTNLFSFSVTNNQTPKSPKQQSFNHARSADESA